MKKLSILVVVLLLLSLLSGCTPDEEASAVKSTNSDKIQIVSTLFPQYDFARQIAGDKAEVTLLLLPGMESHSYEPTPLDIKKINDSDLFIYTGKNMEIWSQKIVDGMKSSNSSSLVLDVSEGMNLLNTDLSTESIETDNSHEHVHDHGTEYEQEHNHGTESIDPHIWTDPIYAKKIINDICDAICSIDPANGDYYKDNAARYNSELDDLHEEFQVIVRDGHRNEIIFASRFALSHFTERYGLAYQSAFDSCSSETEPSARRVAELVDRIKEDNINIIYYAEMEDPKVARSISRETGAKMLLFHSCHNVTKEEFEGGATYLSLMWNNAVNLKEGLK